MTSREILTPEGLRGDGRRAPEIRRVRCKVGVFPHADGSAYFEQGNTKCLVSVYGPHEVTRKSDAVHDKALVRCEFSTATFAAGERRVSKGNRQAVEIGILIASTFDSVIMAHQFPNTQIDIIVQVIQSDGGSLPAAINATTLAIIDAGIPMKDFVVACAASSCEGVVLCDPNYLEASAGGPLMPIALMPKTNKVVLMQMDETLDLDKFQEVLDCATKGCHKMYEVLHPEIQEYVVQLVESRGH